MFVVFVALLVGFSCGYLLREVISQRRRAAVRKLFLSNKLDVLQVNNFTSIGSSNLPNVASSKTDTRDDHLGGKLVIRLFVKRPRTPLKSMGASNRADRFLPCPWGERRPKKSDAIVHRTTEAVKDAPPLR
jgi:hypothetical protein